MAYREFHYEKQYEAPDTSHFLDASTQAVSHLFQNLALQHKQKQINADQFTYDLSQGKFENDQKILTEFANHVVDRGKQDIFHTGKITNETSDLMNQGKGYQQLSQIQLEKTKALQADIASRDAKDPYYDGTIDSNKLKIAVNGENNDVNFLTRGERLNQAEKTLGGVDSFKYSNYRADYVKNKGEKSKIEEYGNDNVTKSKFSQGTFWDTSTGKLGVTNEHAIDYLKSDPQGRVDQYFTRKVGDQLSSEIAKMKASGDSRTSWMKGKSDEDIKNELINDPSKNIINSQDFGVRKRDLAKADLAEADRINSKVSVDYKADKDTSGGLFKNPNIVHSYSFNNSKVQSSLLGSDVTPTSNPGAGGVIFQKSGKPIVFSSTNPIRTDINTGTTNKSKIGNVDFNLTGYQLQAFKQDGAPMLLHGNNSNEMVDYINRMPLEYFDPKGKYKLQPELKIALQGYTVNKANILNAANNQEQSIQQKIYEAQNKNDADEIAVQEANLEKVKTLKSMVGAGVEDGEISLAASRAGINGVQVNELVQASDTDLANVKAITQGLDLKNPEYHNDDMRKVQAAYKERYNKAVETGFKSEPVKGQKKTKVKPITPEDFNAKWSTLKSGESLMGPDGINWIKK